MKRRILSIITALALCLSLCPTWALAVEADPSLCKHHPEHTEDCGYIAPTEGLPCGHRHTAECYTLGVLPDADSGDPYEVGADTENLLDCHHSHNSECGYVQADPGQPCGYACRICPIEVLIAALPEQVTEDNADDVRGQLDHILDLYRELNENEQGQLDLSHVTALQETLDAANAPMAAAETINVTNATNVTLTAEDGGCQGHTFTGTAEWAMIYVESGAHDVTFSDLKITASAMVGVAPGATMNLTIEGTNMIRAGSNFAGIYVPADAALTIDGAGSLNVSGNGSAGIGGGAYNPIDPDGYTYGDPNCGTVEIKGGTVTATGGRMCAGIGGGSGADYSPGNGGTVTISGGTVTAAGGVDSSGKCGGAGIGGSAGESDGSYPGSGGTLTISGGHVTLTAGNSTSYGFGQATGKAPGGTCELTLTDASYLAEGTTLDPNGKYTITGDPTPDMIVVPEDLIYSGKAQELAGRIYIDDSKTGTGTYFGRTFTVNASAEGWVLQDLGEVVEAGEYTAVFKKDDKEISKTFTVAQSGTQFVGDGEVKTYNGDTLTTSFSAGDTITVKATPTPTGDAPQKAAARLRADPTKGQMVVYVGTTQVSVPADKGEDGSYTMTVSAADVLLAAGGPGTEITLTARFTANDNMADGTGTATVNITAAAKAERDGNVIDYFGVSDFEGTNNLFFQEAYADATITLLGDVQPGTNSNASTTCSTMVNITCSLDLTGHNFTSTDIAIYVLPGGNLTIQDSSTGKTGTVSSIKSDGTLQLYGGTFGKIETAYTLASLLAENCAYYKGSTPVPLSELEGKTELTGPVTVQACQHTAAEYTPNENDASTHTKTCLACGYTETGDCGFEKTADPTADSHTGQCPNCKRDRSGAHSFSDWAGNPVARTCTVCGYEQTAVARVEKDSTTTYVGALADAFTEGNSGATVTLLSEVDLGSNRIRISGSNTFTLDLNGQTVKASYYGAFVIPGGSLTIQDSGTGGKIESSNITIEVTGGTLSIQSGTVSGYIGVQISSGAVNISGGTISGSDTGLKVAGGGNIAISGGTFSGVIAVEIHSNASVTLKDLLAAGYAYHQNDIPVANAAGPGGEVPLDAKPAWLTGTVTVKECNHTGGLVPSENGYQHGGPCKCCGSPLDTANHTLGADNQCSGCGAALVAKVEKSGSDTVYVEASNLASAFAAENTGATVTLLKDVDLGENDLTLLSGTFTLDCGAFTLSSSSEYFVIKLDNADLTFAGGTIQCNGTGNAVLCAIGTFTMTGGTLNAASDYALNCAYSGEANIQGGTVGTQGKGLCIGNPDTVKLSGGTYATICIVSNYGAQKVPLSTILADGRAAYGPDGPITRDTVDAELTGPIIVKECEHDGVKPTSNSDGTHALKCPYCGYSEAAANCTYAFSGTTTGTCAACGDSVTVAVAADNLIYDGTEKTPGVTVTRAGTELTVGTDYTVAYSDNKNAGENKATVTVTIGNGQGSYTEKFTIDRATPTITWSSTSQELTYTSQQAVITAPTVTLVNNESFGGTIHYSYTGTTSGTGLPTNAGTYTIMASITAEGNYTNAQTATPLALTINKADQAPPAAPAATEENIKDTSITLTTIANAEYSMDGATWQASPAFTGLNPNQTYTFYARLKADDNHNASPNSPSASITTRKMMLDNATVTVGGSYIYTGAAQTPAVAVVKNGKTLTAGTDYTVSYANNTNAGTATVTITGMGDYEGTNSTTFTIQRKTLTVAGAIAAGRPYNGTNTVTITGVTLDGIVGSDAVSVDTADLTGTLNGSNVGSYAAVTLPALTLIGEKADNYTLTRPAGAVSTSVTISKADAPTAKGGAMTVSNDLERTYSYSLDQLLPVLTGGQTFGTVTYSLGTVSLLGDYYTANAAVTGDKLSLPINEVVTNDEKVIGTVEITISSTNFKDMKATITISSVEKIVPEGTPTASPNTITYGQSISAVTLSGQMSDGTGRVDGRFTWDNPNATPDAGTYQAAWTFIPTDTGRYTTATGTVTITVRKATPSLSLTPSPATLPNGGTVTLTLSGLPDRGSATVTCSDANITVTKGSGNTWTADLPAGGASYTFTASYSGDGNHNGATANCTVSVEKITPTLSLTANPTSLHGGGTVTLTLSGLPAGGTATVTCSGGITVTAGAGNTWTATLPNNTATYTFTASYAGNASYNAASASCTVEAIEVTVLPNPPAAEDGKQYQVVMEDGISEVPAGLQSIETLNTPEKLETAMKTAITQANSGVPQDNTAVYDVELQISDNGGATWTKATAANFPANGLTVTLPYPAGTNSGYTFTVVHMFTTSDFGKTPGHTETPTVTNTADGLRFTVTGLSPISVGWVQPSTPTTPTGPTGGGGGGGGWSSSTYAVTVERAEHGKVTSNRTNASSGSTVTLTVTPDTGYVLDTLTVTDSRGSEIKLTAQGGGKYTFTMPGRAVTVKAAFAPLPDDTEKPCDGGVDCPSHGFTDLGTVGTWYHEAVDYVLRNNLMGGYGNGLFGPNDTLTRAQFAQILYNKEGRPAVTGGGIFTDVAPVAWCAPAITWAAERGIVGGYGNGAFGPNDNITREQLAVMLWRYAGSPAATDKELHFNDADKASGYALEALRWAVENGIINGKGGGILDPKGLATRAQTAQMLKNFLKDD